MSSTVAWLISLVVLLAVWAWGWWSDRRLLRAAAAVGRPVWALELDSASWLGINAPLTALPLADRVIPLVSAVVREGERTWWIRYPAEAVIIGRHTLLDDGTITSAYFVSREPRERIWGTVGAFTFGTIAVNLGMAPLAWLLIIGPFFAAMAWLTTPEMGGAQAWFHRRDAEGTVAGVHRGLELGATLGGFIAVRPSPAVPAQAFPPSVE